MAAALMAVALFLLLLLHISLAKPTSLEITAANSNQIPNSSFGSRSLTHVIFPSLLYEYLGVVFRATTFLVLDRYKLVSIAVYAKECPGRFRSPTCFPVEVFNGAIWKRYTEAHAAAVMNFISRENVHSLSVGMVEPNINFILKRYQLYSSQF
jgi:hypothetical protein